MKNELQRMLRMKIIQPSKSEWGAPCILVRKPLENGFPQPPRFVVDYRGLTSVTRSDGYPIPSILVCLIQSHWAKFLVIVILQVDIDRFLSAHKIVARVPFVLTWDFMNSCGYHSD